MIHDVKLRDADWLSPEKEHHSTSDAVSELLALFDEGSFSEIGAFRTRETASGAPSVTPSGVICGYGAVDGALVFAFAQDSSRASASLDAQHAEKIEELYRMALKAGAPVIGIFDSEGVDIEGGIPALMSYGRVLSAIQSASGKIPQIALLLGTCRGLFSVAASMFDFTVRENSAVFGAVPKDKEPLYAFSAVSRFGGITFIHDLLSYLPRNAEVGVTPFETADSLNRRLSAILTPEDTAPILSAVSDNAMQIEVFADTAPEILTAFTVVGGIRCGIFMNVPKVDEGRLSVKGAEKLTAFLSFCSRFRMPIVSFVHSAGLPEEAPEASLAEALAAVATAYITARVPKVSVILGKAIGAASLLFGSHAMGCDVVYALESAEIGALATPSAVAFAWNERITSALPRAALEKKWWEEKASALAAARAGEVDDIIPLAELRKRVASSLLMLTAEGTAARYGGSV